MHSFEWGDTRITRPPPVSAACVLVLSYIQMEMTVMATRRVSQISKLINHVESIGQAISASASVTIVQQNGQVLVEKYFGTHHHCTGAKAIGADSRFNVYSVRKTYVGLATAIALLDGSLRSLDDDIGAYLGEIPTDVIQGTTIRHLITRTHGLAHHEGKLFHIFPPGYRWQGSASQLSCSAPSSR